MLFGKYLSAQFGQLLKRAKEMGIVTTIWYDSKVTDVTDDAKTCVVTVEINGNAMHQFDRIVICTGHYWPVTHEGTHAGYFDSPYPPKKLSQPFHHPIAIRGASLTAIDAIRTLARQHGRFVASADSHTKISYQLNEEAKGFSIVMHSRNGMLPAVRFHLEDSHLSKDKLLTKMDIEEHRKTNNGFLSLDYIFDRDFKEPLREKDPVLYGQIRDMRMEEFVTAMIGLRERVDAFDLLKGEYTKAAQSIHRRESIHWKEALAILSFAMNYPAKHFCAEDMQRLQQTLMPLISIVIAFVPQSSVEELLALHAAGLLSLADVGADSEVVLHSEAGINYRYTSESGETKSIFYQTYIDCVGQPHLNLLSFPFKGLLQQGSISEAKLEFSSAEYAKRLLLEGNNDISTSNEKDYYLRVSGIAINDHFQAVDSYGAYNERIYIMAVPYIAGFNPDYSGLDFCEAASKMIVTKMIG